MKVSTRNLPVLGAICGDIIGSAWEGYYIKTTDFDLFSPDSSFTDDTICTIAMADALSAHKPLAPTLREWGLEYIHLGYGGLFRRWLKSTYPEPYQSWGNGSAMRVSPAACFATSVDDAARLAEETAVITHDHPEGIKGAVATACAIYLAKEGRSKDEIKRYVQSRCGYDLERRYDDIQPGYEFDVTCQGSVPESIVCFLESDSYEDTVRRAVAMGGDTDTMPAIAGSIAAAFYGEITPYILDQASALLTPDIIDVIDRIA